VAEPTVPTPPPAPLKSSKSTLGSFRSRPRSSSLGPGPLSGIAKDVALKVIPKKKVKGNEASVWSEMDVLKGLDHHNIVRANVTTSVLAD
jgi:calcium/calmodulin-dependent protein kinase I